MKNELVEIVGEIKFETDKAILFQDDDTMSKTWLAKSQIEFHVSDPAPNMAQRKTIVTLPEWLAIEKELI
ncbi:MAG: hypothetical protein KGL39_05135 [Patescibacteria group bacterium]|nr:hypothetical protein [Patescibacteria group bacterium]